MKLLFIVLMLSSCSPAHRLVRLIEKNPELVSHDTVIRLDTFIVSDIKFDTSFVWRHETDTITLHQDRMRIKIIHRLDSVWIQGECKGDTVIKEVPVYINNVNPVKSFWSSAMPPVWVIILFFLFLLFMLYRMLSHDRRSN